MKTIPIKPLAFGLIQRLWYLAIICTFFIQPLQAQYFSTLYSNGEPVMLFGSVQAVAGKFYVTGITDIIDKAVFAKIDSNGAPVFFKTYIDSSSYEYDIFLNSLKRTSDGNFIATGNETDSVQRAFLMKVDSNGNILLWHQYTDSNNLIFQGDDVIEVTDSGYLIAINMDINDVSNVRIVRTDLQGNILNQRDYYSGQIALPEVIRSMYNGHYMVGAFRCKNNSQTPFWEQTWLIEVDSMGNMVRDWLDTDSTNSCPTGMEQTADSGWIIVRQHVAYDVNSEQAYNGSILKLDKSFNKQWNLDTGIIDVNASLNDVKILNDGNYICVGAGAPIGILGDSTNIDGWLMKVSSAGQVIWQRFYEGDSAIEAVNSLNSVELMPDGGFVACGQKQGTQYEPYQAGWILRTDSNGCLVDNCWLTAVTDVSANQFNAEIFPNPSKNNFSVKLSMPPAGDIFITVYDIAGRLILRTPLTQQTTTIQNQLNAGMYLWQITGITGTLNTGKLVIEN